MNIIYTVEVGQRCVGDRGNGWYVGEVHVSGNGVIVVIGR